MSQLSQQKRGALRDYVLNIPPGGQELVQAVGDYFRVTDADGGRVNVSTSKGDAFDVQEGEGARVRDFESLRVRNDAAITLRVRLIVGSGAFESSRTIGRVTVNPAATVQAVGIVAGGGTIPANPDRKELIIRARTINSGAVSVGGVPLYPGEGMTLPITSAVPVAGAAYDQLNVSEVI